MSGHDSRERHPTDPPVLDEEDLVRRYRRPRSGRLVFTNGVFDLLHRGHVASLVRARDLGDALVVGVNSDDSARRLKGPGRPLQADADRAWIVASLRCVDAVTVFDDDTPVRLIERLLPDVLVKGADYAESEVAGADEVRAAGGAVHLVELEPGRSTTALIEQIRDLPDR